MLSIENRQQFDWHFVSTFLSECFISFGVHTNKMKSKIIHHFKYQTTISCLQDIPCDYLAIVPMPVCWITVSSVWIDKIDTVVATIFFCLWICIYCFFPFRQSFAFLYTVKSHSFEIALNIFKFKNGFYGSHVFVEVRAGVSRLSHAPAPWTTNSSEIATLIIDLSRWKKFFWLLFFDADDFV